MNRGAGEICVVSACTPEHKPAGPGSPPGQVPPEHRTSLPPASSSASFPSLTQVNLYQLITVKADGKKPSSLSRKPLEQLHHPLICSEKNCKKSLSGGGWCKPLTFSDDCEICETLYSEDHLYGPYYCEEHNGKGSSDQEEKRFCKVSADWIRWSHWRKYNWEVVTKACSDTLTLALTSSQHPMIGRPRTQRTKNCGINLPK